MERITASEVGPSIPQAYAAITSVMQQVSAMGRNDYELPALRRLLADLEERVIAPADAVAEAISIRDGKQDYN